MANDERDVKFKMLRIFYSLIKHVKKTSSFIERHPQAEKTSIDEETYRTDLRSLIRY